MVHDVVNINGEKVGTVDLNDSVFNTEVNHDLIYRAVTFELANKRTATAFFKNRGLVKATTKKMYRQKGTGYARHGSMSANIFVGGGQAFGGQRHNYSKKIPKKMKKKAISSLLSIFNTNNRLAILNEFALKEVKTREAANVLKNVLPKEYNIKNLLVILKNDESLIKRALQNIEGVCVVRSDELNALDLYKSDFVLFSSSQVVENLQNRLLTKSEVKA